nr:hypothetical protein GCM10010200_085460 [Actinomadura rugatobispora]
MGRNARERRIRATGRTGEDGAPTRGADRAWRRLVARGPLGPVQPALLRLASDEEHAGHVRRVEAQEFVAEAWARRRDPELREVARALDVPAAWGESRWESAALQGRLAEVCGPADVRCVPGLLLDGDDAVRADAARFCATDDGALLEALWRLVHELSDPGPLERELLRNPHRPSDGALEFLWSRWLDEPSEPLGGYLLGAGWPAPEQAEPEHALSMLALGLASAEALCRGLLDDATPGHLLPRLARTCRERELLPDDPGECAVFRLLLGDIEQLRASDPDGSLLAAGYAGAGDALRARVLEALTEAGELERIRDLAARPSARPRGVRERTRLVDRLAADEDWPRLWRLALDVAPLEAGEVARRISPSWRPSGEDAAAGGTHDERDELFRRLRDPGPSGPAVLRDALLTHAPAMEIALGGGAQTRRVAISPDGRRLAVTLILPPTFRPIRLLDIALPSGDTLAEYETAAVDHPGHQPIVHERGWRFFAHTGDAVLAVVGDSLGPLVRYADGERHLIATEDRGVGQILPVPGGVAVVSFSGVRLFRPPYTHPSLTVEAGELGLPRLGPFAFGVEWRSGRIAVAGPGGIAVLDGETGQRIAFAAVPEVPRTREFAFVSERELVTADGKHMHRWLISGNSLVEEDRRPLSPGYQLRALPLQGLVAWTTGAHPRFADAASLLEAPSPVTDHGRNADAGWRLSATPMGERLVSDLHNEIRVDEWFGDRLGSLLHRPLAEATPSDLAKVEEVLAFPSLADSVAEPLRLLRLCLRVRFGDDIALGLPGGAAHDIGAVDDIALGRPEARP